MTLALLAVLVGFVALVWSADRFVTGAAVTAKHLGMSSMMIGLTIVAFGTSAPEIFVSLNAALHDAADMAVGNALGSNLANMGLVLAVTALITAIPISKSVVRRELPILAAITLLAGYTLLDYKVSFVDGCLLLGSIFVAGYLAFRSHKKNPELDVDDDLAASLEAMTPEEELDDLPKAKAWMLLIGGLVVLVASSNLLVWGAKSVAIQLGVSQLIIGLTLVAIGTSLPELAASVACALKGQVDIALGNVVGSNIFNLAAVMSIPGLVGGVQLGSEIFNRDYAFMAGITLLLIVVVLTDAIWLRFKHAGTDPRERPRPHIGRFAAVLFLLGYVLYTLQLLKVL
ncbi:MAG: calcium/sodium antiporter [Pseudomonadales bacterium]